MSIKIIRSYPKNSLTIKHDLRKNKLKQKKELPILNKWNRIVCTLIQKPTKKKQTHQRPAGQNQSSPFELRA